MSQTALISGVHVSLDKLLALRHKQVNTPNASSKVIGNRAGQKLSKVKGRGVDFAEVRPYQPGDDVRTMDWRVTARKNKPHTKVFREERERPVLIALDQTQNMFFGSKIRLKSVAAAEICSRIAWQNLAAGDRVGGIVIGNTEQIVHKPLRSTKSVARMLNSVALFNQRLEKNHSDANQQSFYDSLQEGMLQLRRLCKTNYRVFIVSDFSYSVDFWQVHLHQLARHNEVVLVHVSDPLDAQLPPADHYAVSDGQSRLQFYTGEHALRERYQARYQAHQQALMNVCLHDAMTYLNVMTNNAGLDQMSWV